MKFHKLFSLSALISLFGIAGYAMAAEITIATVNNGDMVRMQRLSSAFTQANPDITLNWVVLEENVLRQRVTTDIATKGGQFDVMTIGTYEVPIWAKEGWLIGLNDLGPSYDINDLLPAIRSGLTYENTLYASPFYGESSMVMYRTDLFASNGLTMPENPTWGDIYEFARAIHNPASETYGACLRGKAGWGENAAFITTVANSFGARWFDENWNPQFDTAAWNHAVNFYVDLLSNYGPPGASTNGFNENLALFNAGKCGMWIDATVAASFVTNPSESRVADSVGFALAPCSVTCRGGNWLWAWSLAIPAGTQKEADAKKFIAWATSKEYLALVASQEGWANVPPGTRTSLYTNPQYTRAAAFAERTLQAINSADPITGTLKPKPYVGVQFVAIPEFQEIGTRVGQEFSAALAGRQTVERALSNAQKFTARTMKRAGYN